MDQKPTATADKPHVVILAMRLNKFNEHEEISELLSASYELNAGDIVPAYCRGKECGNVQILTVEPVEGNDTVVRATFKKVA